MNIKEILTSTIDFFKKKEISEPRLDAEVLLANLLNMDRIQLYVNYDLPLKKEEINSYRELVLQRAKRVPVAYLTQHKEFMSLDFIVNKNVLIPRPETELMVEEIIKYCKGNNINNPNIVDLCTGSGVIAVSLGYYLIGSEIFGIDISEKVLEVASLNIKRFGLTERVKLIKGDLLNPLLELKKDNVDIVVSNPPYISKKEMAGLSPEVKYEPELALSGGIDGLVFYRRIIPQAGKVLKPGGLLILEIGYNQADAVKDMLNNWQNIKVLKDYAHYDRIVLAQRSL